MLGLVPGGGRPGPKQRHRSPIKTPAQTRRLAPRWPSRGFHPDALRRADTLTRAGPPAAAVEHWLDWLPDWLEKRDAAKGQPVIAATAALLYLTTGRSVESERWAGMLDRWQYQDPDWPGD